VELFKKDIFSDYIPIWSETNIIDEDMGQAFVKEIKANYSLFCDDIIKIRSFKGFDINSSNFILTTPATEIILKVLDNKNDYFLKFAELERARSAYELPIPQTFLNNDNCIFTNFGNKKIMLSEYKSGNFFKGGEREFKLLNNSIQKIIDCSDKIDINSENNLKFDSDLFHSNLIKIFNNNLNCSEELTSKYSDILFENYQNILDSLIEVKEFSFNKFDQSAYHIDLHPHNIIMSEFECTLIDIDSFHKISLSQFIGFTLFKLIRQQRSHGINNFLANDFIKLLRIHDSQKLDLTYKSLRIHAIQEILRRLSIIFEQNLYTGESKWNSVIPLHLSGLKECNLIFSEY